MDLTLQAGEEEVGVGKYISQNTPLTPFSPVTNNLMVSVDVKHHVYLLTISAADSLILF